MGTKEQRLLNQVIYRQLKDTIAQKYKCGRFVALYDGQIVGDADELEELRAQLQSTGRDPKQALVVQAGVDYPDNAIII